MPKVELTEVYKSLEHILNSFAKADQNKEFLLKFPIENALIKLNTHPAYAPIILKILMMDLETEVPDNVGSGLINTLNQQCIKGWDNYEIVGFTTYDNFIKGFDY